MTRLRRFLAWLREPVAVIYGVPKHKRCPVPGCPNEGTPAFLSRDVCPEHAAERAQTARDAWVDPAALRRTRYADDGEPVPCGACGHPRWAHARPGYYDGPCLVPECDACDGGPGHAPGYVPGVAA